MTSLYSPKKIIEAAEEINPNDSSEIVPLKRKKSEDRKKSKSPRQHKKTISTKKPKLFKPSTEIAIDNDQTVTTNTMTTITTTDIPSSSMSSSTTTTTTTTTTKTME